MLFADKSNITTSEYYLLSHVNLIFVITNFSNFKTLLNSTFYLPTSYGIIVCVIDLN